MQNLEIQEALRDLENNIPYEYCRGCDSPDGLYHEYIDEDSWQYKIKMLLEEKDKEIERLNNNWNKLEKYLSDKVTMHGRFGDLSRMAECQIISQKLWEIKGDDVSGD